MGMEEKAQATTATGRAKGRQRGAISFQPGATTAVTLLSPMLSFSSARYYSGFQQRWWHILYRSGSGNHVITGSAVARRLGRIAGMEYSHETRISRDAGGAGFGMFVTKNIDRISPIPDIRRAITNVRWEISTTDNRLLTYSTYKKELARTYILPSLNFTAFISNPNTVLNAKKTAILPSDWWRWDRSYDQNIVNFHRLDKPRIPDSRLNIYSRQKPGTTSLKKISIN